MSDGVSGCEDESLPRSEEDAGMTRWITADDLRSVLEAIYGGVAYDGPRSITANDIVDARDALDRLASSPPAAPVAEQPIAPSSCADCGHPAPPERPDLGSMIYWKCENCGKDHFNPSKKEQPCPNQNQSPRSSGASADMSDSLTSLPPQQDSGRAGKTTAGNAADASSTDLRPLLGKLREALPKLRRDCDRYEHDDTTDGMDLVDKARRVMDAVDALLAANPEAVIARLQDHIGTLQYERAHARSRAEAAEASRAEIAASSMEEIRQLKHEAGEFDKIRRAYIQRRDQLEQERDQERALVDRWLNSFKIKDETLVQDTMHAIARRGKEMP